MPVDHPNIVRFVDVYEDKRFMYVIMERCDGGEVFDRLVREKRFHESEMIGFCCQIFSAIEFIHDHRIIHRDIKAENFLYSQDGTVKLVDFGLAVTVETPSQSFVDVVGSPHYMAPEMLNRKYSYPVDLWSSGVLLYLMLYGRYPFDGDTDDQILRGVKSGNVNWVNSDFNPSPQVLDFLMKLIQVDPDKRLTPVDALNDPFLRHKSSSEKSDIVIVSEVVTEKLNRSVVIPGKNRRKLLRDSSIENRRNSSILELEKQFTAGMHRGWRKSSGTTSSAPTSPIGINSLRVAKGTTSPVSESKTSTSLFFDLTRNASSFKSVKRASSLPGSRVKFDLNPPEVYVYTDGASGVVKVSPVDPMKQNSTN